MDTDLPFLLGRRLDPVGQASSLTVHGASVPRMAGGRMPPEPADKMSAPQAVRLDAETELITLPHEVFTELGTAIKSGSPFRFTIMVTLAKDLDCCTSTRRAFEEGNYEPTTCPLAPGCGERLVADSVKLLHELKP